MRQIRNMLSIMILILFTTGCVHDSLLSFVGKNGNDGIMGDYIGNTFNKVDKALYQGSSGFGEVKEKNVNHKEEGVNFLEEDIVSNEQDGIEPDMFSLDNSLDNFDSNSKGFQWWQHGDNEKTWRNLHKMSLKSKDRVKKFYDILTKAIEDCKVADKSLDQAIADLEKLKKENVDFDEKKDDRIFEALKKLDVAMEIWRKAQEAEKKAERDCKLADNYSRKIEATIEVFERFMGDMGVIDEKIIN